ncbi:MAG: hypothetical protein AAB072_03245, partial [Nitrospirota bacterium]
MTSFRSIIVYALLVLVGTTGCQMLTSKSPVPGITSKSRLYTSVVDRLAPVVQPDIEKQQGPQQPRVLAPH